MSDDITQRLRAAVPKMPESGTPIAWPVKVRSELLLEAAAQIERLRAEIERLYNEDTKTRHALRGWVWVCPDGGDEPTHERVSAVVAEVERLREVLIEWDALIKHQFSGSREAMTDMQYAALKTKRILDELDAPKALEAKP